MLTPDRCTECDLEPGPCTSCQLRTALADVEAMRAEVRDAKAEAEKANDSAWGTAEELRNVRAEYEAMRVVCDAARAAYEAYVHQRPSLVRSKRWGDLYAALRALDARATPSAKEKKP